MKKYILTLLILVVANHGYAQLTPPPGMDSNSQTQNVVIAMPEVALLDLEATAGTVINLNPTTPTEAGLAVAFPAIDNSIWMNYSSIVGSTTEPSRNVTVQITSGTVPSGTILEVLASADAGSGDGTMGAPAEAVTLSNNSQNIITGIGSAYTGDGVSKGHNLSYTLDLASAAGSYALLDFDDSSTLEITYTLSDN